MKVYVPAEEELRPRELLIITDDGGWDVDLPRRSSAGVDGVAISDRGKRG